MLQEYRIISEKKTKSICTSNGYEISVAAKVKIKKSGQQDVYEPPAAK